MRNKKILFLASLVIGALALGSCGKSEDKGPMEKAGKAVDQAIDKAKETTGQAMEKAGEAIKEAGEKMREGAKK